MKFEGRDSAGEFAAASLDLDEDKFAVLILLVFYMGKVDSRRLDASRRREGRASRRPAVWRPGGAPGSPPEITVGGHAF